MKIQILDTTFEQSIEGYDRHIDFKQLHRLQEEVSDNECSYILAPEILSSEQLPQYSNLLQVLLSKLRLNGELVVGGTDLAGFADAVSNKKIDTTTANHIVARSKSMANVHEVCQLINSLCNFNINWSCTGVHYEIKIRRV